jgi:general secretion pathway protein G
MTLPRIAPPNRRRRERGFTLLELMVVVAILGLLAVLVGPEAIKLLGNTRAKTAALDIKSLSEAMELYKLDVGGYPSTEDGLAALVAKPSDADNWAGPYIKGKKLPTDPWKKPYIYHNPSSRQGTGFDICTYGEHGQPGGSGNDATICND